MDTHQLVACQSVRLIFTLITYGIIRSDLLTVNLVVSNYASPSLNAMIISEYFIVNAKYTTE